MGEKREDSGIIIWDCGSPLYDSYEIASFGHLIERKMMALPSPTGPNRIADGSSTSKGDQNEAGYGHDQVNIHEALGDVGFFGRFLGRRLLKRKRRRMRTDHHDSNEKVKKLMRSLFYSFFGSRRLCRKNI
ncbi:hypothetical protein ACOSQ3_025112 [Xanthoceras sorbifolium]